MYKFCKEIKRKQQACVNSQPAQINFITLLPKNRLVNRVVLYLLKRTKEGMESLDKRPRFFLENVFDKFWV